MEDDEVGLRDRIGKWRIQERLGRGGTSTVYAATNAETGAVGALKLFHRELSQNPRVLKLLLAEARLVAAVGHAGTVAVLDDGVDDECAYIVFELLHGRTLEGLRQNRGGRIPIGEVMRIGDAVMDALSAVHAAGIVHRDLKPANIFVLEGGGVKLLDFGFAKLRGYTADAAQNIVGTPSFMPPESALGLTKKIDAQSDVWSLGATFFYVLSGQSVHIAQNMDAMILASASNRPRSLAEAAPELSTLVTAVVDRALSYRKADRWPDVATMRRAWQEAHPHWLPTLPPPRFVADPTAPKSGEGSSFLDPSLLQPDLSPSPLSLFDPRDLANEPVVRPPPVPKKSG